MPNSFNSKALIMNPMLFRVALMAASLVPTLAAAQDITGAGASVGLALGEDVVSDLI